MTLDEVRMLKKVGKAVDIFLYLEQCEDDSFYKRAYIKMRKKVYDEIKREYPKIHLGEPLVMAEGK